MHGAYLLYVWRDKPLIYIHLLQLYLHVHITYTGRKSVINVCFKTFLHQLKCYQKKEVSCCIDGEKEGVDEKDIKSEICQFNN